MNEAKKLSVISFIMVIIVTFMTFRDLFVGGIHYTAYHIIGKATFFSCFLIIGLIPNELKSKHYNKFFITALALMIINCAHGLSYEPGYHMGFNLCLLFAVILFNGRNPLYFFLFIAYSLAILAFIIFTFDVRPGIAYLRDWQGHAIVDFITIAIFAWIINKTIFEQVRKKEVSLWKYQDVGRQTSKVIHDLKGGFTSPILYVDHLLASIDEPNSQVNQRKILTKLKSDLKYLSQYTFELNQFNRTDKIVASHFLLSDCLKSTHSLIANQLMGVEISMERDAELFTDENLMKRIFMNLFINTVEAKAINPKVHIKVKDNLILYSDNGPGFPDHVLSTIKKGETVSTKSDGSGLGCQIIIDYMKALSGRAQFKNGDKGALIKLALPKVRPVALEPERRVIVDVDI